MRIFQSLHSVMVLTLLLAGLLACKPRVEAGSAVRSEAASQEGDVDAALAGLNANVRMLANDIGMDVAMLDSGMNDYSGYALADGGPTADQTKQKIDQLRTQLDDVLARYKDGDDEKVTKIVDELTVLQKQYASMDQSQQQQTQQAVQVTVTVVQQVAKTQEATQTVQVQAVQPKVEPVQKTAPVLTCVRDPRANADSEEMVYSIASDGKILDFSNAANEFMSATWCETAISNAANGLVCAHISSSFVNLGGSAVFNVATRKRIAKHFYIGHKAFKYCYAAVRAARERLCFTRNGNDKTTVLFDVQSGADLGIPCDEVRF